MIQENILVSLGEHQHKKHWLESDARAQRILKEAKNNKITPYCLCRVSYQGDPVAMHIKARDDRYSLCRNPGTGQAHHVLCSSHDDCLKLNGRAGLTTDAIQSLDNGELLIHPKFGLSISKRHAKDTTDEHVANSGIRHNRVTLLGFLHLLHELSGFHRWYPTMCGKRNYACWVKHMRRVLDIIHFPRGKMAGDFCCFPERNINLQKGIYKVCTKHGAQQKAVRQALIIGRLLTVYPTKFGFAVKWVADSDQTPCYLSENQWENVYRSYIGRSGDINVAWKLEKDCHYYAIARVRTNTSSNVIIDELAVMPTTAQLIPFDSSHEKQVIHELIKQERSFIKPLRYDAKQITFPDFILLDTESPVPMEIYGIKNNPEYEARKHDKNVYYKRAFEAFWQWDLAQTNIMPVFPSSGPVNSSNI